MRSIFNAEYKRALRQLVVARKNAGLTQHAIANKLKKPQSFVSKYERGERRLDVVEFFAIARVIGIDPLTLLRELSKSIGRRDGS